METVSFSLLRLATAVNLAILIRLLEKLIDVPGQKLKVNKSWKIFDGSNSSTGQTRQESEEVERLRNEWHDNCSSL